MERPGNLSSYSPEQHYGRCRHKGKHSGLDVAWLWAAVDNMWHCLAFATEHMSTTSRPHFWPLWKIMTSFANWKYITYSLSSSEDWATAIRQHGQKFSKVQTLGFWDMLVDRQIRWLQHVTVSRVKSKNVKSKSNKAPQFVRSARGILADRQTWQTDMLITILRHYLKRLWKIVIMFCIHIYQKASINTIILGNADITKPSYLKQLT